MKIRHEKKIMTLENDFNRLKREMSMHEHQKEIEQIASCKEKLMRLNNKFEELKQKNVELTNKVWVRKIKMKKKRVEEREKEKES